MFKVYNKTSPEIMQEIFTIKEQGEYNLRNQADFVVLTLEVQILALKVLDILDQNMGKPSTGFKEQKNN